MEIIRKTRESCTMTSYGGAFIPSQGLDSFGSVQVLYGSTHLFSEAVKFTSGTPLTHWQQRMIYLSPLAVRMLPSFQKPQENVLPPNNPTEESKSKTQSHYPLMIYDNLAKVFIVASVVIISSKEGYHQLGGMCMQGSLIYARNHDVISQESYLTAQIGIGVIGLLSRMIVEKSFGQRVFLFVEQVPKQLYNVYLFPSVSNEVNPFLKKKVKEVIESDDEIRAFAKDMADKGWIDSSILEVSALLQTQRDQETTGRRQTDDEGGTSVPPKNPSWLPLNSQQGSIDGILFNAGWAIDR